MNRKQYEAKFLDLIEGKLSDDEASQIRAVIESDAELKRSFQTYRQIMEMEHTIAAEEHQLHPNFVVTVMDRIEGSDPGLFKRWYMKFRLSQRMIAGALATCAVAVIALEIGWDTPEAVIPKERTVAPVKTSQPSTIPSAIPVLPLTSSERAITVPIDTSSASVEQHALPGARADVVITYQENGMLTSKVISQDVRVLAVDKEGSKTATFATSAEQAARIQMAAKLGTINLVPSAPSDAAPLRRLEVTADDLSGHTENAPGTISSGRVRIGGNEYLLQQGSLTAVNSLPPAPAAPGEYLRAPGLPYDPSMPVENRERYGHWEENPRIRVADEAVSTFSIDVDTGSYTNVRRFLSRGQLPPADAVRIEEFINYFDYSYPVQYEKPFGVSYEIAPSALDPERFLLKLGVKARDSKESTGPRNLVFLIDVSGSMSGPDRLELVKQSLKLLVNRMRPSDKIGIVTYAGYTGVALEPTSVKEKERIISTIDQLGVGGSTNGSGGIIAAYELANRARIEGGVNRVILATDGDFNVGTTSQDELIRLIEEKRRSGITLTTIGVGEDNLNEAMMEQLANKGNGNYFYLDSFQEARKVFETDLTGTIEVVAKDVKLQIEFNPKHIAEYRLIGYDNRKLTNQDFNNDQVDAGEIGSGHTVTALYEIVLADSELAKRLETEHRYQKEEPKKVELAPGFEKELAFLKVRFKEPNADTSQLLQFPIEREQMVTEPSKASNDLRFATAIVGFGQLLRNSQFKGSTSFDDVLRIAEGARGEDKHGYRREFIELVRNASAAPN